MLCIIGGDNEFDFFSMYNRKQLLGSKQVSEPSDIKDNFYKQQGPTGLAKKLGWVFLFF